MSQSFSAVQIYDISFIHLHSHNKASQREHYTFDQSGPGGITLHHNCK